MEHYNAGRTVKPLSSCCKILDSLIDAFFHLCFHDNDNYVNLQ